MREKPSSREFDNYAQDYQDLLNDPIRERFAKNQIFFHQRKLEVLLDLLAQDNVDPASQSWLDVGCGKGELLEMGGPRFALASGCDPSPEMMNSTSRANLRLQEEPNRLPFADASFDLVTAVCVYHHVVPNDRKALGDEIRRVLRPGGRFCIFEHNPWNPATRIIVSRCPVDRNAVLLTRGESISTLRQSGLTSLASRFFLFLPERVYRRVPAVERLLGGFPFGGQFAVLFRRAE
jgi:SAM-dependent methyltransferase